MTDDALAKSLSVVALIMAGIQNAQQLKEPGADKKAAVKKFVQLTSAGLQVFKPHLVDDQALDTATDNILEAIVSLAHLHQVSVPPAA